MLTVSVALSYSLSMVAVPVALGAITTVVVGWADAEPPWILDTVAPAAPVSVTTQLAPAGRLLMVCVSGVAVIGFGAVSENVPLYTVEVTGVVLLSV